MFKVISRKPKYVVFRCGQDLMLINGVTNTFFYDIPIAAIVNERREDPHTTHPPLCTQHIMFIFLCCLFFLYSVSLSLSHIKDLSDQSERESTEHRERAVVVMTATMTMIDDVDLTHSQTAGCLEKAKVPPPPPKGALPLLSHYSPIRIRICFVPKRRENALEMVKPMMMTID